MKKLGSFTAQGLLILTLIAFPLSARAARHGKVDVDGTEVLGAPRKSANVLMKLKVGQKVMVSNYPTEGYYKVRTSNGTLGWVKADSLILGPLPDLSQNGKTEILQ